MKTTRCRSCGALIVFARTTKGTLMPLDAEPTADGNVTLEHTGPGLPLAQVHGAASLFEGHTDGVRYMPHHATCPQADEWRAHR